MERFIDPQIKITRSGYWDLWIWILWVSNTKVRSCWKIFLISEKSYAMSKLRLSWKWQTHTKFLKDKLPQGLLPPPPLHPLSRKNVYHKNDKRFFCLHSLYKVALEFSQSQNTRNSIFIFELLIIISKKISVKFKLLSINNIFNNSTIIEKKKHDLLYFPKNISNTFRLI